MDDDFIFRLLIYILYVISCLYILMIKESGVFRILVNSHLMNGKLCRRQNPNTLRCLLASLVERPK